MLQFLGRVIAVAALLQVDEVRGLAAGGTGVQLLDHLTFLQVVAVILRPVLVIPFVQFNQFFEERVTVGVLADAFVFLCLLLQKHKLTMEHAHALHDAQVLGVGRLDLLRQLVMVGTLAGLESFCRVVFLQ